MNTEPHAPAPPPALKRQRRGRPKRLSLSLVALVMLLSSMPVSHALETSSFANYLAVPPPFDPEAQTPEADSDRTGDPRASSLASMTGNAPSPPRAPEKSPVAPQADIIALPFPATGSRRISQAIAASKKDEMLENEWKMGFELRSSPVLEAHGDAERHDSIGGLIKGNIRF